MDAITGIASSDITGYHSSDIKSGSETHTDDSTHNKEVLKGLTFMDSPLGFSGELFYKLLCTIFFEFPYVLYQYFNKFLVISRFSPW